MIMNFPSLFDLCSSVAAYNGLLDSDSDSETDEGNEILDRARNAGRKLICIECCDLISCYNERVPCGGACALNFCDICIQSDKDEDVLYFSCRDCSVPMCYDCSTNPVTNNEFPSYCNGCDIWLCKGCNSKQGLLCWCEVCRDGQWYCDTCRGAGRIRSCKPVSYIENCCEDLMMVCEPCFTADFEFCPAFVTDEEWAEVVANGFAR